MPTTSLDFALAAALYTGFQWTIRVLVYPQFAEVGAAEFARYERRHQHRVSVAVGPLFVLLGGSSLALLVGGPPVWAALLADALVGLILLVTAFGAVPLHRILSAGFTADAHRRLLRVDSVRLAAAVAATALGAYLLAR